MVNQTIPDRTYFPLHVDQNHHSAWFGHIPFGYTFIKKMNPSTLVELGTHHGGSYFSFCDSIKNNNLATTCHAIDTWEGEDHAGKYGENVFAFIEQYNNDNFNQFSHLIRTRFDDAARKFKNSSIDLLHIDGFHSYEAVLNDYETWKPKMANCGVILFHDTCVERPGYGVKKFWEQLVSQYPSQCFNFNHSHGLGVFSLDSGIKMFDLLGFEKGQDNQFRDYYEKQAKNLRRFFKFTPKILRKPLYNFYWNK